MKNIACLKTAACIVAVLISFGSVQNNNGFDRGSICKTPSIVKKANSNNASNLSNDITVGVTTDISGNIVSAASSVSLQDVPAGSIYVYDSESGQDVLMNFDVYLMGVVYGEMPVYFGTEALKAQAVAARTFVLYALQNNLRSHGRNRIAAVCTDHNCCQEWKSPDGSTCLTTNIDESQYPQEIREAVLSTRGIIITYNNEPINAMYCASSGGMTANITDVWDEAVEAAYLQSVPSVDDWRYAYDNDVNVVEMTPWTMLIRLRQAGIKPQCTSTELYASIKNIDRSDCGRIKSMEIGGITVSGTEFRAALGLRSTKAYVKMTADGMIAIVTQGYGHGVGMSQSGAAAMCAEGYGYKEILEYYYKDTVVTWSP